MKYRYLYYILILIPVFIFRDYTPANELKYISIVDEALREGTWFTFYNHGEVYADKPPLYFWLLMASRLITGGYHLWIMGLFSVLPAVGILWIMDRWTRSEGVLDNPLVPNILLLTTGFFLGGTLVLRMDMMMTFFITLSLYTFYKLYKGIDGKRDRLLLPVWVFLAVFSKGAVGVLFPLLTMAVFLLVKKEIRLFPKFFGLWQLGVLVGLCGLWFLMIYLEGGTEYLNNILFKQTVGRGVNSFHHKEPFWYYVPRVFMTFAPWSLFFAVMIWKGVRSKLFRGDMEKLFYTAVWSNFVLMSLVSSKIDIYLLPIYPFVVYLAWIASASFGKRTLARITLVVPAVVLLLAFPVSLFAQRWIEFPIDSLIWFRLGALVVSVCAAGGLWFLKKNKTRSAIVVMGSGLLLLLPVTSPGLLQVKPYMGFEAIATEARGYAHAEGIDNYTYYRFYTAPNMDVFLGKEPELIEDIGGLEELAASGQRSILFIRRKDVQRNPELGKWLEAYIPQGDYVKYYWYVVGGTTVEEIVENEPAEVD